MIMMELALFSLLGVLTGAAVVLSRRRQPDLPSSTYWNTGIIALASTAVVASAAYLTASILWVGQGELGIPQLGPVAMALCGLFPAFMAGLALSSLCRIGSEKNVHEALYLVSGLGLGAAVAALAVVSGQAIVELRPELSRPGFMGLLGLTQALLLASPALGFAAVALNARSQSGADAYRGVDEETGARAAEPQTVHEEHAHTA